MVAAIFGCLANASRNTSRLEPLHALIRIECLGPFADEDVEGVLVAEPRLETGYEQGLPAFLSVKLA